MRRLQSATFLPVQSPHSGSSLSSPTSQPLPGGLPRKILRKARFATPGRNSTARPVSSTGVTLVTVPTPAGSDGVAADGVNSARPMSPMEEAEADDREEMAELEIEYRALMLNADL